MWSKASVSQKEQGGGKLLLYEFTKFVSEKYKVQYIGCWVKNIISLIL